MRTCLRAARWAAAVAVLLSVGIAFAIAVFSGKDSAIVVSAWLVALLMVFSVLQAPQFATFVLGCLLGALAAAGTFAGLVAGMGGRAATLRPYDYRRTLTPAFRADGSRFFTAIRAFDAGGFHGGSGFAANLA